VMHRGTFVKTIRVRVVRLLQKDRSNFA